jgi:DNA-binding GntR family transcriptional regulator
LIGKSSHAVYEMIREKYGEHTSAVCVDLAASTISQHMAASLGAKAGDPSLRIVRRYFGAERRIFQVSVSEHPADRYYYRIELRHGTDADGAWTAG